VPILKARCFAEFGWAVWAKAAFEEYFMLTMRYGAGMPWFERLGLRALCRLRLFKPAPAAEAPLIAGT